MDCYKILKYAIEKVTREKPDLLNLPFVKVRMQLVLNYGVPEKCLRTKTFFERALLSVMSGEKEPAGAKDGFITVTYVIPRKPGEVYSPGAGLYPNYSIAEAIYVGLYEEDPVNAHEKMYELLEPLLLSNDPSLEKTKKAVFMPADSKLWKKIMEHLVKVLEILDEEKRNTVCRCLCRTFDLLVMGLPYSQVHPTKIVVKVPVHTKLIRLCPDLAKTLKP